MTKYGVGEIFGMVLMVTSALASISASSVTSGSSATSGSSRSSSRSPSWSDLALRFTAESTWARQDSIRKLRKIKNLEALLIKELTGSQKFLALDVIGTLRLQQFIPKLQDLAYSDRSGMTIVTLNSLMTPANQKQVVDFYLESLEDDDISPAAKVIIIDTLARLRISIKKKLLISLFQPSQSPEVRSSILNYIRSNRKMFQRNSHFADILQLALAQEPYQLRLQTLFLVSELNQNQQRLLIPYLSVCMNDVKESVRKVCGKIKTARVL